MDLARYAPDDTNAEAKKIERFLNGLHNEMQCVLVTHTFDDLEALVEKAIQMESKRKVMLAERKRRMMSQGGSSSQRTHNYPTNPKHVPQPPRAPASAPRPNYPNRPNANYRPGGNNNNNNANRPNVVCFECGVRGHYSKECPNPKNAAPRPNAPAPNRGPGRGGNGRMPHPVGMLLLPRVVCTTLMLKKPRMRLTSYWVRSLSTPYLPQSCLIPVHHIPLL